MGYREATAEADSLLGRVGETITGHEFHRTAADPGETAAWLLDGRRDGVATPTLHASYLHVHWAGNPHLARRFADAVRREDSEILFLLRVFRLDAEEGLRAQRGGIGRSDAAERFRERPHRKRIEGVVAAQIEINQPGGLAHALRRQKREGRRNARHALARPRADEHHHPAALAGPLRPEIAQQIAARA